MSGTPVKKTLPEHLPWQVNFYGPRGKRNIGRPKKRWKEHFQYAPNEISRSILVVEEDDYDHEKQEDGDEEQECDDDDDDAMTHLRHGV